MSIVHLQNNFSQSQQIEQVVLKLIKSMMEDGDADVATTLEKERYSPSKFHWATLTQRLLRSTDFY